MIIDTKIKMLESLTADLTDKRVNNPYNLLIKLGRILDGFPTEFAKTNPELVLMIINKVDELILFKRIEEFFTLFPPIKNYVEDGTWTYKNTLEYVANNHGEYFGKDVFKEFLMNRCYENKFIFNVGLAFMIAISTIRRREIGIDMFTEFFTYEK
ncbi:hypothetical protein COF51_06920 [Bacillus pseudomycoides]|uniref:hypothetical protein n=1 Tax=Bacillus pseudomycoides TaxID=64104 RepID=UPI000BF7CCF5|nr:hypothetical protein [Bacillus pseudomycoides]PGE98895.1 hypothetical protein COM62_03270 [Bacillus pseudomycoides]PHE39412.1 hypothetical protein COF51_06920 [Bacillus pseudomycoides]